MSQEFYLIECSVNNLTVDVYLNDIPVVRCSEKGIKDFRGQINEYMIHGENTLSAVINPGVKPSLAKEGSGLLPFFPKNESMMLKLVKYPRGAEAGGPDGKDQMVLEFLPALPGVLDGEFLSRQKLNGDGTLDRKLADDEDIELPVRVCQNEDNKEQVYYQSLEPLSGPFPISMKRAVGEVQKEWTWQKGETSLNEIDRKEIFSFLERMHKALIERNYSYFVKFSNHRLSDLCTAYPSVARDLKERQIRLAFTEELSEDWWAMQPLLEDSFDLRLCANGNMVECCREDGTAILKSMPSPTGNIYDFSMFLCKIDGIWQIVR
ncbi:MAG: hypothetical protein NE330_16720 [Lentisphaeraceae bacterium]|nr:hypothetical protein [Lentisphaeraceae bacterium]